MSEDTQDLPDAMTDWISQVGGGRITNLQRHVARREAWVVDVTQPDGSVLEGFLRLQRETDGVDPRRLERETRIVQALGPTQIPVPKVFAWSPELRTTLFERDPGRSDLDKLEDSTQQRAVMEDFIRVVARLHTLDIESLGLDDVMHYKPTTPSECALSEVDLIVSQWSDFLSRRSDPLTIYGLDWLRRYVPDKVARVSLIQGDTGPVNFMFLGDRVSAVIDWELGHYGDPLEDLGNIAVREFWNPSGGLAGLFELYGQESGIPYDRFRVQYYAIHQNIRGMIPIHYICEHAHPRESVAWHLSYRYVGDRATCEMLADAMGVEIDPPQMPEAVRESDVLADAAAYACDNDIVPVLEADSFAASRARDIKTLVACMDRRRRYEEAIHRAELEDVESLLGHRPASLEEGRKAFAESIRDQSLDDGAVIRVLARKAYRDEWLYAPAAALHPNRRWSKLD